LVGGAFSHANPTPLGRIIHTTYKMVNDVTAHAPAGPETARPVAEVDAASRWVLGPERFSVRKKMESDTDLSFASTVRRPLSAASFNPLWPH